MKDPEPWDKPSEKLRRIAELTETPNMRLCVVCHHFHPRGQRCGMFTGPGSPSCRCER